MYNIQLVLHKMFVKFQSVTVIYSTYCEIKKRTWYNLGVVHNDLTAFGGGVKQLCHDDT